jgi:hypothetical protein
MVILTTNAQQQFTGILTAESRSVSETVKTTDYSPKNQMSYLPISERTVWRDDKI